MAFSDEYKLEEDKIRASKRRANAKMTADQEHVTGDVSSSDDVIESTVSLVCKVYASVVIQLNDLLTNTFS